MLAVCSTVALAGDDTPTFSQDIAPILQKQCVSCHTESKSGPFSLVRYAETKRRARQLVQVTQSGYMPPWKATNPGLHGERRLTDTEKAMLQRWADTDCAEGTPNATPAIPPVEAKWSLGPPDRILTMPQEYTLPATTNEVTRCFVLPAPFAEDRALRAVVFRPRNPRAVRYALLYLDTKKAGRGQEARSGTVGFFGFAGGLLPAPMGSLADSAVGSPPLVLPVGAGTVVPRGADLILQVRFHTTGRPETEKMEVGLYFAPKSAPTIAPVTVRLGTAELYMPRQSTATLTDTYTLPTDATVLEIVPNAHPTARTISLAATLPDGKQTTLLTIDDWDSNWKQPYQHSEPPRLPAGTLLTLTMTFDNTEKNPRNPWKPSHRVVPGLEFMEEMGSVWVRFLPENAKGEAMLRASLPPASHQPILDTNELEPEGRHTKPRPGPVPRSGDASKKP